MQDYNIYLHATSEVDDSNKTKPSVNRTEEKNADGTFRDGSALDSFTKVKDTISSFASSGFEGIVSDGIAKLGKIFPAVAIAYAILKISDSVIDTTASYINNYTGNYEFSIGYNNFKAGLKNVLLPVSYAKRQFDLSLELEKQNTRISEERNLVGSATMRNMKIGI